MRHILIKNRLISTTLLATCSFLTFLPAYADIVDGKYSVNQTFDVQRSPAFPTAGSPFNLSNFAQPFRDNGTQYDIDTGYISFFYTGDNDNLVGIRLYDSGDSVLETISTSGDIYGLEEEGFLYVADTGGWGTFVSNNEGFSYGDSTSYITSEAGIANLADLMAYIASSSPLGDGETASGGGGGNTLLNAVQTQKNTVGYGAAQSLDSFVSSSSDVQLQAAFSSLSTAEEQSDAVSQTLPVTTGSTTNAVLNTMGQTTQIIQARTGSLSGLSSGDGLISEDNMWFKPFYTMADQNNENGVIGYETEGYGMAGGYDHAIGDWRVGAAISYGYTTVDSNDERHDVDIESYEALLYSSYSLNPKTEANFIAGAGYHNSDSSRTINIGGIDRIASADYDSWSARVGAGIGHVIKVNSKLQFIPSARIDYTYIKNENYLEAGAGGLDLNMDSQSTEQLIPEASGKATYKVTDQLSFDAQAGIGYNALSEKASVTSTFVGGGSSFTTEGIEPSPWRIRSGASMQYQYNDSVDFSVHYDREDHGADFNNQSVSAKLMVSF
ncbi:MAG: autotransporter outer membrane beta-barrel domain-containing protein [Pseudomonadota bacterium]